MSNQPFFLQNRLVDGCGTIEYNKIDERIRVRMNGLKEARCPVDGIDKPYYRQYLEGRVRLERTIVIDELVTLFYFEFAKNYRFAGESHDFWEMVYVDHGEVTVTADDAQCRLTPGTIIFHKPGEFHSFYASGGTAPNIVVVSFCSDSPAMAAFERAVFRLDDKERDLLSGIVREGKAGFRFPFTYPLIRREDAPFGCEQRLLHYLESFLLRLLCSNTRGAAQTSPRSLPRDKEYRSLVQAVIGFMERRIDEPLTLGEISQAMHVTKARLKEVFKEQTGQSVMRYFSLMKMERAKKIIREEACSFSEVAERLGFATPQYFSNAFKKLTGASPSEYARSVKARSEDF
ncbi:AraC family transcriptional regulator [Paenibacillus antri]|nr:AraC family transcriptional regulator [Paenibacillus antri]